MRLTDPMLAASSARSCCARAAARPVAILERRRERRLHTRRTTTICVHQRIEVKSFDWDSTSLRRAGDHDGRLAAARTSTRVVLDMGRRLEVRSVTGRPSERRSGSTAPATRWSCGSPAPPARRHGAVHRGLPRPDHAGPGPLLLPGRAGPAAPAAAGLQRRRDRREPALDSHLRRAARQGDLGADRHGAGRAHRGLQRAAGERRAGAGGTPYRRTGPRKSPPPPISSRSSPRRWCGSQRSLARHAAGLLRLPRGQRARPAAVRRHARHDGGLRPAHRRAVSLDQVRPGHRGRLHRRDGERRAPPPWWTGCPTRAPTATGPGIAQRSSPTSWPTSGSATW